jgi:hypothetical protein
VGFGDSMGFLTSVTIGRDLATNATNHFLYVNLVAAFSQFLPSGSLFGNSVLFSIICSVITIYIVYKTALLISANNSVSLSAAVMLALSFTYWRQTEIIEVYTCNNMFFTGMLYFVTKDIYSGENRNQLPVTMFYGIALLVHIQNILLIPFYLIYLWQVSGKNYLKILVNLIVLGLVSSVLIIIPLVWKTNSVISVFFDDNFQDKATEIQLTVVLKGLLKSIGYFLYNFHLWTFFILHGIYLLFRKNKQYFILLVIAAVPFWGFACRYDVPDNYVFFQQAYICMVIASVFSLQYWLCKFTALKLLPFITILCFPLFYWITWNFSLKVKELDDLNRQKAYKGGLKYLLWPGMRANGGDLLKISKEIYSSGIKPESFREFEWNYNIAVNYLELTGQLPDKKY